LSCDLLFQVFFCIFSLLCFPTPASLSIFVSMVLRSTVMYNMYISVCSLVMVASNVCVLDFCCNEVCRCLWNPKSQSEKLISTMAAKLKARKSFGQRNKFQSSLKFSTAQHTMSAKNMDTIRLVFPPASIRNYIEQIILFMFASQIN